jgi:plasmid rolling circle replication initiator protein Rep
MRGLTAYGKQNLSHRGLFLTLTVRNVPLERLGEELDEMNRAWARMTNLPFFPSKAWFRRTEVTLKRGSKGWEAHPHFHALILVRPSYFTRDYVKQTEWRKQWMMAARLDYSPVVDVRSTKKRDPEKDGEAPAPMSAVMEAAKYATKATDLLAMGPAVVDFHEQMRGKRLYSLSRELSAFVKSGELEETELMDTEYVTCPDGGLGLRLVAEWNEASQKYEFAI